MNPKQIVRLSNIVGLISIFLLIYWVFTFITVEVFQLRVFRRGISELFAISIMGILAVIFAALVINIMFNLTRIAQKHNVDTENKPLSRKLLYSLIILFPLILAILFGGHFFTLKQKKQMLIDSANTIVSMNQQQNEQIINYHFTKDYILTTAALLDIYQKTDDNFRSVKVIVQDSLFDKDTTYLEFSASKYQNVAKDEPYTKADFIRSTTQEEREYLNKVFNAGYTGIRYTYNWGNYELFYPYHHNGKTMVLYFSDYQHYGKLGSS